MIRKEFGMDYHQKIVNNMCPVLVKNNFDVYFNKRGFVFERKGLENNLS
jgi:hypothetical protein